MFFTLENCFIPYFKLSNLVAFIIYLQTHLLQGPALTGGRLFRILKKRSHATNSVPSLPTCSRVPWPKPNTSFCQRKMHSLVISLSPSLISSSMAQQSMSHPKLNSRPFILFKLSAYKSWGYSLRGFLLTSHYICQPYITSGQLKPLQNLLSLFIFVLHKIF